MRHSFGLDVLACPHCGGRMRHVATVFRQASIQRILRHLEALADQPPHGGWRYAHRRLRGLLFP